MSVREFFRPRLVSSARGMGEREGLPHGQAERFRGVMLPHMDAAYSFARYLARDSTLAEDLVQEAFLHAFRAFDGWRGENAKAWLLAIVRNCHVDSVRRRGDALRGADPVEAIDEFATTTTEVEPLEDTVARQSEAAMVRRTIANLPEPFRETLVLRELEELSYKEISAITGVPIGTVMSRLARARAMLCAVLLPENFDREAKA